MKITMDRLAAVTRTIAVAAALLSLTAATSVAQSGTGSRWQGWLGCWTTAAPDAPIPSGAPLVCITPTSNADVVDVTTVADGKVLGAKQIDASGTERPLELKDCTGTQRAEWSADGRRVYLKAVANCAGATRTTSGILAIAPTGDWLDVQGIAAGEGESIRVARYRDAGVPSTLPASIASALEGRSTSVQGARIAAGAAVGTTAVIEASKSTTPAVVEAWLLERGQQFALDARSLVALADAGVPARVTDAMVAVSNPKAFAVAHPEPNDALDDQVAGRRISVYMEPMYDPYGWGYSPYYNNGYGYGYGRYGYGSLGYGGYGYGYPGYYSGAPIIIVGQPGTSGSSGKMVKGQGYVPNVPAGSTGRRATPRSSAPSSSSTGSSRSAGSSSSQGSSSPAPERAPTPAPAPAPERTAHPRP
jgi:hypothetical protein